MLPAPTVHCTLLFCITPFSVHLFRSLVVKNDLVLEPDDDRSAENLCERGGSDH